MSRLTDLIRRAKSLDAQLGADLDAEYRILANRRAFGLNFERHQPEAVELPGRPVRRGDKVRILPPRGTLATGDHRLWRVTSITREADESTAHLRLIDNAETVEVATTDLVVVAEFRDAIYPGLVSTGRVENGEDSPFHIVINAENYHALQALTYTHRERVDVIYLDPPYNSGAKDWKYNNDYVDTDDAYRHSKWLAMMERRLLLAQQLLNPHSSVLIIAIDEKEYLRLGLLLAELFPEANMQMVTTVISAKGVVRAGQFSRVEEYLFILTFGEVTLSPATTNMLDDTQTGESTGVNDETSQAEEAETTEVDWLLLRRREPSSVRGARPNQFYPFFVNTEDGSLHSIGDATPDDVDRTTVAAPDGTIALWPLNRDGDERLWGLTPETAREYWRDGYLRVVNWKPARSTASVKYLPGGTVAGIRSGEIVVTGHNADGTVIAARRTTRTTPPKRVWNVKSHNAETGGTNLLTRLIPGRRFDYPKSLYAVEDVLRFFVKEKPNAIVLDFFAGSGTTAHAVMRLNRQDGGHRQSISVTNNEVAATEHQSLRLQNHRPGDDEWDCRGICEYITKPRLTAAITGHTHAGNAVTGDYKFNDMFPIAEGFPENIEFFKMTYNSPTAVSHHRAFESIAALLWLRAGASGRRIDHVPEDLGWEIADTYGVLSNLDNARNFTQAVKANKGIQTAFIVTDDARRFQMVCSALPAEVRPIRLYESYLLNFEINTGILT